ncbi:MAG: hypothetical protein KAS90_01395 [Candidatus Aenigmarchaeota archaeon]|nr:hypothetical protein [Candidatus Aenigmarchaeota archaeon]
MLDLSYLNDFEGRDIKVISLLDPKHNNNKTRDTQYGKLTAENGELSAYIFMFKSADDINEITRCDNYPYLGQTETLWNIEALDDGSKLLQHKKTDDNKFKILGPDSQELGILSGLSIPYSPPYWDWHDEQVDGKNGEDYSIAMEKLRRDFKEWRISKIM